MPTAARASRPGPPAAALGLSDEEQILAAKYLPRDLPPRLFEEERFLFPESYHVNRVRLLVQGPRLDLRLLGRGSERARSDREERGGAVHGAGPLEPSGLRSRRTAARRTSCFRRARAGGTCVRTRPRAPTAPSSGSSCPRASSAALAESNRVTTPRVGPSASSARRRRHLPGRGGSRGFGRGRKRPWPRTRPMRPTPAARRPSARGRRRQWTAPRPGLRPVARKRPAGRRERHVPARRRERRLSPLAELRVLTGKRFPYAGRLLVPGPARPPAVRPPSRVPGASSRRTGSSRRSTRPTSRSSRVLDGLLADGVEYRLTMTSSPPLVSMMTDELLVEPLPAPPRPA